jgi:hypothetical protein
MRYLPSSFILLLVTACFAEPDRVVIRCDAEHPCPQGQVCLSGTCGQGGADLGAADSGADLAPPYGCTVPNGRAIGRAWACPVATLARNQASSLCAQGFKLCTSGADVMSDPACRMLSTFYAAELIGTTAGSPDFAQCQSTANPYQVFYGCGRIELNAVYQVNSPCQQLERVIDCNQPTTGWTCGRTLADTSTTVPAGVLCCPQ